MPTQIITASIVSLLCGIRAVESCDGLDVRAKGNVYQITSRCVYDTNRIFGTHYKWPQDVRNRETSENIILMWLTYYGVKYYEEYHAIPTAEVLAKIYHCGYAGFKRGDRRGEDYWKKIKAARNRSRNNAQKRRDWRAK